MTLPVQLGVSVATKAINGEEFVGTVIAVDRYGFAVVDFGVSHARIPVAELKVVA